MEPSYSVWADWLSKFHTWPEAVQALWVVGLTVTALGLIAGTTRVLVAFAGIFERREAFGETMPGWRPGAPALPRHEAAPALTDTSRERREWPDHVRS